MWIIAGVLLGVVLLAGLAGVHTGPHAHGVAVVGGIAVAAWFLFMAADGHSTTDNGILSASQISAHHTRTLQNISSFGPRVTPRAADAIHIES